jgi:hypothetical protein
MDGSQLGRGPEGVILSPETTRVFYSRVRGARDSCSDLQGGGWGSGEGAARSGPVGAKAMDRGRALILARCRVRGPPLARPIAWYRAGISGYRVNIKLVSS